MTVEAIKNIIITNHVFANPQTREYFRFMTSAQFNQLVAEGFIVREVGSIATSTKAGWNIETRYMYRYKG